MPSRWKCILSHLNRYLLQTGEPVLSSHYELSPANPSIFHLCFNLVIIYINCVGCQGCFGKCAAQTCNTQLWNDIANQHHEATMLPQKIVSGEVLCFSRHQLIMRIFQPDSTWRSPEDQSAILYFKVPVQLHCRPLVLFSLCSAPWVNTPPGCRYCLQDRFFFFY